VKSPVLKSVINVVVGIPDLVRNPGAALGNLVGRLTGAATGNQGWADELTKSPINTMMARGVAGNGRIDLQESSVRSAAFQVEARGGVTLAPVLTNSAIQIPVKVSLRQSLAEKAGLVPAGTPTNATYVKLPDFVTMKGTVGQPKADINYLAITAVAAKAGAGIGGRVGGAGVKDAADVMGIVGNLLGGGGTTATNTPRATTTNQPPTNQAAPVNPFDLFKKKKP
jgi:hypothetical protein